MTDIPHKGIDVGVRVMKIDNINLFGIIGIVGSVILIFSTFLPWAHTVYPDLTYTGWELFRTNGRLPDYAIFFNWYFAAYLGFVVGLISLVLMTLCTVSNSVKQQHANNLLGLMVTVIAMISISVTLLFYAQTWDLEGIIVYWSDLDIQVKAGFWYSLIGAMVVMSSGVMPIIRNKLMDY